jgi:hypothetical protein
MWHNDLVSVVRCVVQCLGVLQKAVAASHQPYVVGIDVTFPLSSAQPDARQELPKGIMTLQNLTGVSMGQGRAIDPLTTKGSGRIMTLNFLLWALIGQVSASKPHIHRQCAEDLLPSHSTSRGDHTSRDHLIFENFDSMVGLHMCLYSWEWETCPRRNISLQRGWRGGIMFKGACRSSLRREAEKQDHF